MLTSWNLWILLIVNNNYYCKMVIIITVIIMFHFSDVDIISCCFNCKK